MTLKIGFLTTIAVNVGDEFIREGIRAVLDRSGVPYAPLYVNKHDPGSLVSSCEDEPFAVVDKYWDADVFIQSGAPVYWHLSQGASTSLTSEWHRWMWQDRILKAEAAHQPRFLNIGAGSCQPWGTDGSAFLADQDCVRFAREAAARASITTVRDPLSARILAALGVAHKPLPCPAFLAAARHNYSTANTGVIGLNLMPLGGHYQLDPAFDRNVWMLHCWILVSGLRKLGRLVFVAHDDSERAFMSQFAGAGERVFSAPRWRDYLDVYGNCVAVLANRVHGAVCAAGFGVPSVIIGNDSRALIADYIGIPKFRAGVADPEEVMQAFASLLAARARESERLCDLRNAALREHVELIAPILLPAAARSRPARPALRFEPRIVVEPRVECAPPAIVDFAGALTAFAEGHGLPLPRDASERWAYAWLWLHALGRLDWTGLTVVDLHSQANPLPWFLGRLGANVTLLASRRCWIPSWERWRSQLSANVTWRIAAPSPWPFDDSCAGVVTAFSVARLDSQTLAEAGRVLQPGGLLALSLKMRAPRKDAQSDGPGNGITSVQQLEEILFRIPVFRPDAARTPKFGQPQESQADRRACVAVIALQQKTWPAGRQWLAAPEPDLDEFGPRTRKRIEDLLSLRNALEAYHQRNGAYPRSSGGWDGLYSRWGNSTSEWIPGLAPDYLLLLPRDPRNTSHPEQQYLYRSDGRDYKIICHGAEDTELVRRIRPDLIDPARKTWAYGFFTAAAAHW